MSNVKLPPGRPAAWVLGALLGALLSLELPGAIGPVADRSVAPAAPAAESDYSVAALAARRAALQVEIAALRVELSRLPEGGADESAHGLTEATALLERIDAVHAEQQRTGQHAADLAKEVAEMEERLRNQRPVAASFPPPHSLPLLDQLYDERDSLSEAVGRLKREIDTAELLEREARETLAEKERLRRAVRQAGEAAAPGVQPPGSLRLAAIESRLAQETVRLREQELKALKLQQSLLGPKQKLLLPRFDWLRTHLTLAPEEPAATPPVPSKRFGELGRAIVEAKKAVELVTAAAITTERRGPTEKNAEELESRRADRLTAQLTVSVLTAQRERLAEAAKVAEWRRQVLTDVMPADELRKLASENQEVIDQLAGERRRKGMELFKHRQELQQWQGRLARAAAAEEKSPPWAVERVKRLTAWLELSTAENADLDRLRTARSRLQEEIGARVNLFSWSEGTAVVWEAVGAGWNYEIFSVQDQPVRVKTILAVLLLVVLGYHAARWLSRGLARTVLQRLGMNIGQRAAWQALWFYALFLVVLVVAFNLFHVSLTKFSVVSGALAVGIGFGSQNLIGNFISGIILLIERPVNQGDVIEIDGRQVTVEQVGARSTIVRSLDNTHIIVPNSRLLEQPVTNWTLSDDVVRKRISVGVDYSSSTRQVDALLHQVVAGLETVRKEPAPLVTFADFGESALVFEIYFSVGITDWLATETELRHRIVDSLVAAQVVLAFPQRNVHLATTAPLQVALVSTAAPAPPERRDAP